MGLDASTRVATSDDVEAVRLAQQGDRGAFRVIVERYRGVLFGTAYEISRDRFLAEDLAQDTLVLAWRHIGALKDVANLKAWLLRILVNRAVSHGRRRRVPETTMEWAGEMIGPHDAEQTVLRSEEASTITRALETRPAERPATLAPAWLLGR